MGKLDQLTGAEVDPWLEVEGEWWRGGTREGRKGWFPKKWVEVLERRRRSARRIWMFYFCGNVGLFLAFGYIQLSNYHLALNRTSIPFWSFHIMIAEEKRTLMPEIE